MELCKADISCRLKNLMPSLSEGAELFGGSVCLIGHSEWSSEISDSTERLLLLAWKSYPEISGGLSRPTAVKQRRKLPKIDP